MGKTVYKVNGEQIKSPPVAAEIELYNLTYSNRTADGAMKFEHIANKRNVKLVYPVMNDEDLRRIERLILSNNIIFSFEFPDGAEQKTMNAYVENIRKIPHRHDNGVWYWRDIVIDVIEQ